jgi:hypothetical protein
MPPALFGCGYWRSALDLASMIEAGMLEVPDAGLFSCAASAKLTWQQAALRQTKH